MEDKRYNRHLLLPGVGAEGQDKLKNSRVLVVGAGGLGSPISMYLAAAGVGTIGIADFDFVDESNLQRQILYREEDVGMLKVQAAKKNLEAMNSGIVIQAIEEGLTRETARRLVADYDVIADATDNFYARYLLSDTCMAMGKPDVYGAICEFSGQVTVFSPEGPCLRCLNPEPAGSFEALDFKKFGVLGALPGLVGCIQTSEVLKILLGIGETVRGRMILIDTLTMRTEELLIPKNPRCPVCGKRRDKVIKQDYNVEKQGILQVHLPLGEDE